MTKKKSFLNFMLVLALIVPCMFMLSACGEGDAKTKIDVPTATIKSFVYDGTEKTLVIAENENYTVTGNTATNVGSYIATISLNDKEKYVWSDDTTDDKTISWSITKASIAVPTAEVTTFVYDGTEKGILIAENENYTVTGNTATNVGSYTATISLNDKENYVWSDDTSDDKTISWTITAKTTTLSFDIADKTYDGTALAVPTVTATESCPQSDIVVEWFAGETAVADEVALTSAPKNAGTYRVRASVKSNSNYTATPVEKTVTIAPMQLTLNLPTQAEFVAYNNDTGAIYDGQNKLNVIYSILQTQGYFNETIVAGDIVGVVNVDVIGEEQNYSTDGFKPVYRLYGTNRENYRFSGETDVDATSTSTISYKIAKKQLTINWPTQEYIENLSNDLYCIYDGQPKGNRIYGLINGDTSFYNAVVNGDQVLLSCNIDGDSTNVTTEGYKLYCTNLYGQNAGNYELMGKNVDGRVYSETYYVRPSNATLTLTATNTEWTATGNVFKGDDITTFVENVGLTAMDGETPVTLTEVNATVYTTYGMAISADPLTSEELNGLAGVDVTKDLRLKITGKNANYGTGIVTKQISFKIGSSTEISTFNNSINFNFVEGNRGDFTRYVITDTYTHQFFKISGLSNNVVANVVGADKLNGDDLISTDDWYVIDNEAEVAITLIHETSAQQSVQIVPLEFDTTFDNDMNYDLEVTAGKSIYLCNVTNLDDHSEYCFTGDSEELLVNAFEVHIFYQIDSTLGDIASRWRLYQGQTDAYVIIVTNGTTGKISLGTYHGA